MNKHGKIWIVSEYYYPIVTSTGYYITEIAEYLATKKDNVNVICTDAEYNGKVNFKFIKEELRNRVQIHRIRSKNIDKNNFFSRIIRLFHSSIGLFFKLMFSVHKNDQVFIVTNPAFLIILMPFLKMLKGIKYTVLVHDIFPENLAAIGKMKSSSFYYKLVKKIYDFSYSQADKCIAIGRDMKEVLSEKIKDPSKIEIITNWSDTDDVNSLNKENTKMIAKLDLNNKFIFQFAGNLGYAQGLDNLIEAIRLVKNNNIHFLFIGSGAMEKNIENFIRKNSLKNVTQIGYQNRIEQEDFLNACDVAIVTLNDGMFGLGVPSKTYNIMATGKPILIVAHEKSEISLCVLEHNLGWVAKPNDPILLSNLFENIFIEYMENKWLKKENSRDVALKYFSKQTILNKYVDLFH
ncbi:MAG: glycosyltransferase family 4 protein [Flavobacterium sp.]